MAQKIMRCAGCRRPATWGGRSILSLRKDDSECIFRDYWHCRSCCRPDRHQQLERVRREQLEAALVSGIEEAFAGKTYKVTA
jgi:hypothetical protein